MDNNPKTQNDKTQELLLQISTGIAVVQTEIVYIKESVGEVKDLKKDVAEVEDKADKALVLSENNKLRLDKIDANLNKLFWIVSTPLILGILGLVLVTVK